MLVALFHNLENFGYPIPRMTVLTIAVKNGQMLECRDCLLPRSKRLWNNHHEVCPSLIYIIIGRSSGLGVHDGYYCF